MKACSINEHPYNFIMGETWDLMYKGFFKNATFPLPSDGRSPCLCSDCLLTDFYPQHLFTGIVDSKEICNVEDCVNRLKMMDAQGQVWGQDMILQVTNNKLQLVDTEAEVSSAALSYFALMPLGMSSWACILVGILSVNISGS